ncbi:vitelline membrane outer layer protein 1-like [Brachyhypopomus gauderio]|uniref:vitelline membrane outer layer protein 1-like n=1 Tax=Brachyhypopomus gauderio TaxID=698409 RepID=UPI0040436892
MHQFSIITVSLLGFFIGLNSGDEGGGIERTNTGLITVGNGQTWGSWGDAEVCPLGTYATGFSLKVEPSQGSGDDTAMNGVALRCTTQLYNDCSYESYSTVRSETGSWGKWTRNKWCTNGYLVAFQLQVEGSQQDGDDTAANNIRFKCSDGEVLEGDGMSWGSWGSWSPTCPGTGICGIETKVELPQGDDDDTALNDVHFYCCR